MHISPGPGRDSGIKHSTLPSSSYDDPSERVNDAKIRCGGSSTEGVSIVKSRSWHDDQPPSPRILALRIGGASPVATERASSARGASLSSKHAQIIRRAVNLSGPNPVNDIPARANPFTVRAAPSMQTRPEIRPNEALDDARPGGCGRKQKSKKNQRPPPLDGFESGVLFGVPPPARPKSGARSMLRSGV